VPATIAPLSLVPTAKTDPPTLPVPVLALAQDQDPVLETLAVNVGPIPANAKVVDPNVTEAPLKLLTIIAPLSLVTKTIGVELNPPVPVLVDAHDHTPALVIFATNILTEPLPLNDNVVDPRVIEEVINLPVIIAPPSLVAEIDDARTVPEPVFVEAHDHAPALVTLAAKIVLVPASDSVVDPKVTEAVKK